MIRSQRALRKTRRQPITQPSSQTTAMGEECFEFELVKEIYRSDRRAHARDFGLIRLLFRKRSAEDFVASPVFETCARRLRVTDTVGWYQGRVAYLLPETAEDGVLTLANDLTRICIEAGFDVDTEISIYPFDDELIAMADEVHQLGSREQGAGQAPQDSGDDLDNNLGNGNDSSASTHAERERLSAIDRANQGADHRVDRVDFAHQLPVPNRSATAVALEEPATMLGPVTVETPLPYRAPRGQVVRTPHRFVPSIATPWWKRSVDIAGAGLGLLLLSPLLVAASIAIKLSSRGPVFFRQQREGKDGQPFGILKFRTMVVDAEALQENLRDKSEQDGPAFKLTNDPRVTWIGRYLRKSCIDELPQLVNVLMGDMSLVGPRPLPVAESLACKAWQRARLTVLPGLTCTWQARGGRDVSFADWMRMDLNYIQQRNFWFDLKLIFETAFIALLHRGSV